jgi:2-keto-3-deoxy-L-rhamnonate aldolase RhmA
LENIAMLPRITSPYPEGGPGRHLKARLRTGPALVGGVLTEYARPSLVKIYRQAGFDFLYIEYEHIFFDPAALADIVLCARDNGLPVIAKTPQLERGEVAKLLECGVVGIQLPRTESRAQVETLRDYLKFVPAGSRAVAPGYGNSDYIQPADWTVWMRDQDAETTLVVHIETRVGFERAEEIISTPGVDMVYLGPGDFSIAMGQPGKYDHPDVVGPMEQILALCRKHQVAFGTTPSSHEAAGHWVARGARFFEAIDELSLLQEAAARLVRAYHRSGNPGEQQ